MAEALGVRVIQTTIGGAGVVGSLVAMNSNGIVLTALAVSSEVDRLKPARVGILSHRLNAAGNNILCNDSGAVVHPGFDPESVARISDILGVPVAQGTVAGMRTVGSAAVATNKGALCHPHTRPEEIAVLRDALRVPVATTTANYGTAQVGACLVANTRGAIIGGRTTPIEMGRIEEGLGYL
jgi:translation initiation factor 6